MPHTGFFAEFHSTGDSALDHMHPPYEWQEMVARYLECGRIIAFIPEADMDPFNPSERIDSRSILTDGVWVWPGELPYLVRHYGVMVPDEFLTRMRKLGWQPPEVGDDEVTAALDLVPGDHRTGAFPEEDPSG